MTTQIIRNGQLIDGNGGEPVANGAVLKVCASQGLVDGRIYVDNGTEEPSAWRLAVLLDQMGYAAGRTLHYVEGKGDGHTEAARRLPAALRFLLRCGPGLSGRRITDSERTGVYR